jgi:hypothetical protein
LLRDALTVLRHSYPEAGWRVSTVKSLLGGALAGLGRYAEAETLLLEAFKGIPVRAGPCGREAQPTRARLIRLYQEWGKPELAARYTASN